MKKFICLVIVLCLSVVFIDACSSSTLTHARNNIAEVHYNLYAGASDEVTCTLSCGKREEQYVLNGVSTPLVDFGLLTFALNTSSVFSDTASFTLSGSEISYTGILEQNPYDGTYVADIKEIINVDSPIIVSIRIGSFVKNITLLAVSPAWQVSHDKALEIAVKANSKSIKKLISGKTFNAEVYIKILADTTATGLNNYYWFVSILSRDGVRIGALIHPMTGEILAERK